MYVLVTQSVESVGTCLVVRVTQNKPTDRGKQGERVYCSSYYLFIFLRYLLRNFVLNPTFHHFSVSPCSLLSLCLRSKLHISWLLGRHFLQATSTFKLRSPVFNELVSTHTRLLDPISEINKNECWVIIYQLESNLTSLKTFSSELFL